MDRTKRSSLEDVEKTLYQLTHSCVRLERLSNGFEKIGNEDINSQVKSNIIDRKSLIIDIRHDHSLREDRSGKRKKGKIINEKNNAT